MWLDALYKNNKWNRAQIVEEKGQHEFVVSYEYKMHYLNDIMHRDSPRKGGSPGCSLVAVLITSFGQAGGFDVRPITSTCYMACANTIFVRGVLLSHVGSGSRLRRRYSKGCPMKYFVQCWCCPLYWIYSLCLLSFFLATWWKGGVRAAPTT